MTSDSNLMQVDKGKRYCLVPEDDMDVINLAIVLTLTRQDGAPLLDALRKVYVALDGPRYIYRRKQ